MDTIGKAMLLGEAGKYDVCGGEICKPPEITDGLNNLPGIIKTRTEGGRFCSLFKTLQTNACKHDCKYCANRAGGSGSGCQKKIAEFEPEELSGLFNVLAKKRIVNGLFLSSGISNNPDSSVEKMLRTVRLVRYKHKFQGYIHFKILPGTSYELVKQASELCSRLSINVEAPSRQRLNELSSVKDLQNDIIKRQSWIQKLNPPSGQTTQIIVGANNETDLEILRMSRWEYTNMNLKRCYYSAFSPVKNTPLENQQKTPQSRANRLYNADWLLRVYKYDFKTVKEALIDEMLPDKDPKVAIAEQTFAEPANIEDASYDELIKIPGIGLKTAERIIALRDSKKLGANNLQSCGVIMKRAAPFIRVEGETQRRLIAFA